MWELVGPGCVDSVDCRLGERKAWEGHPTGSCGEGIVNSHTSWPRFSGYVPVWSLSKVHRTGHGASAVARLMASHLMLALAHGLGNKAGMDLIPALLLANVMALGLLSIPVGQG